MLLILPTVQGIANNFKWVETEIVTIIQLVPWTWRGVTTVEIYTLYLYIVYCILYIVFSREQLQEHSMLGIPKYMEHFMEMANFQQKL